VIESMPWPTNNSQFQGPTLAPFQPSSDSTYASSKVETQTKCAYCVGIAYHAPHLYDHSQCTCPTRASASLDVKKGPYASMLAAGSGPRYEPSQVLRRAGLMSGPPPIPANFPFSVTASKFSTGGAPTSVVSTPQSRPSGIEAGRSAYTFNTQHDRGGLPNKPWWPCGSSGVTLPAELMPRSNTRRQPVGSRPVVFSPAPSLTETEEDGLIDLDYPSQPLSSAWDSDSDLDTIVDNADVERPADADVPSAGLNVNESRSRKRRRTELSHLRRDLQQFRQPRTRHARSPPPSPPARLRRRAGSDGNLPGDFRTERQLTEIQIDAMDLLERSHASLRAYLASYFDSNWTLRFELDKARWAERRAEARLAEVEELCLHHHVIPAPRA
jgi:hypothetical protein